MATKFSSTILSSNLDSLKDKASELARSLEEINSAAGSAGNSLSDMTKGALGDVQNLTSQISRLNSALQRTSTTSSAIGAASVSSALGQLTGQGRGGGGYGGGGGGGSGTSFPSLLGGGAQNLFSGIVPTKDPGTEGANWKQRLWKGTKGGLKTLGKLGLNVGKFAMGMTMSAAQQSRNARLKWEQARFYSPISGLNSDINKNFGGFQKLGLDPFRGAQIGEGVLGAMGGLGGSSEDWLKYTKIGMRGGLSPEAMNPLSGALRAGGQGINMALGQQRAIYGQAQMGAAHRLGPMRGASKLVREQAYTAERDRVSRLMNQGLGQFFGQQSSISKLQGSTLQQAAPLLGALDRGFGDTGVANQVLMQLRKGSLSPGGGAAGQVFNLQAAGFGNPYLAAEQATADRLGVKTSLQSRNYLEAQLFKEEKPIEHILNQMIGVATKFKGQGSLEQGYGLSQITGLSLSRSKELMEMLQTGKFSGDRLRKEIEDSRTAPSDKSLPTAGRAGSAFSRELAAINKKLLQSGPNLKTFSKALNEIQLSLLDMSYGNINNLKTAITALHDLFTASKDGKDSLSVMTENVVKIITATMGSATMGHTTTKRPRVRRRRARTSAGNAPQ